MGKIFEDVRDIGLSDDYRKYVNELDRSGEILDIPEEYYMYYLTPTGSVYGATTSQVYAKDKNAFERILYVQETKQDENNYTGYDDYTGDDYNYDDNYDDYDSEDDDFSYSNKSSKKVNKSGQEYSPSYSGRIINPNFRGYIPESRSISLKEMSSEIFGFENKEINVNFENGYIVSISYTDSDNKIKTKYLRSVKVYKNTISSQYGHEDAINSEEARTLIDLIINCKG
jgi:hypothetical protein